jgi:sigma-B regulation protein RsbU (phosphoserine phosphatase)
MGTLDLTLETLRNQVADIVTGTVFLSLGLTACAVAAMRWRRGVRILVWWGLWSAMFGLQTLVNTPAVVASLPQFFKLGVPYVSTSIMYLLVVVALFAWLELSLGRLRVIVRLEIWVGAAIAAAGIGTFLATGNARRWVLYNALLAVVALLVLIVVVVAPKLARKFLVIRNYRVLAAGTLIFAAEALYSNLSNLLRYPTPPIVSSLGFAVLLFSMGYVALEMVFDNERRLFSIETELETARQIQSSILPDSVPQLKHLRIAASYHPMTAVAGDFYQFVPVDANHLGILVADVSGHGIPAALISTMIKVAMQSVAACAHDPAQVLTGLNRALTSETHGQLASAAYLWIDTESRKALYSAAGHPPLLCWRRSNGGVQRIESNGLLFGIKPDSAYPVCGLPIVSSDRFLLYTDGVTEPENANGEAFGDRALEQVIRENQAQPASELSRQVLTELRRWQPAAVSQQDDITLIVVDVI